ncbi:hypothetical protein D9M72_597820 [compost metagenome]
MGKLVAPKSPSRRSLPGGKPRPLRLYKAPARHARISGFLSIDRSKVPMLTPCSADSDHTASTLQAGTSNASSNAARDKPCAPYRLPIAASPR